MIQSWVNANSHVVYKRFHPDDSLVNGLEELAQSEGIREATITVSYTHLTLPTKA